MCCQTIYVKHVIQWMSFVLYSLLNIEIQLSSWQWTSSILMHFKCNFGAPHFFNFIFALQWLHTMLNGPTRFFAIGWRNNKISNLKKKNYFRLPMSIIRSKIFSNKISFIFYFSIRVLLKNLLFISKKLFNILTHLKWGKTSNIWEA